MYQFYIFNSQNHPHQSSKKCVNLQNYYKAKTLYQKKKKTLPKSLTLVKQKMCKFAKLLQSNCINFPKIQKSDRIYITIQHEKHPYQLVYNCANIQNELHNIRGYRRFVSIILLIFFSLSSCHSPISCSLSSSFFAYQTPLLLLGLFNIFSLHTRFLFSFDFF